MQIAIVRGTVVSSHKLPGMTGVKLLLVQFVDEQGQLLPRYEVAADRVGAGSDEWVLVSRRAVAPYPEESDLRPIDATVVGIIDTVSVDNDLLYSKREEPRYRLM